MRGSIVKRGNKFSVVVDVGTKPDGKRDQRWFSGFVSQKEAQKGLVTILHQLQEGTFIQKRSDTVSHYLEDWIKLREMNMQPNGYSNYLIVINSYILPSIGHHKLANLNARHVRELYASLNKKGYSPNTLKKVRTVLNSALNEAVEDELIRKNVAKGVKTPPVPRNGKEVWSIGDIDKFSTETTEERFFLLFYTILNTGTRRGEALGIGFHNIKFGQRQIYIGRSVTTKGVSSFLKSDPSNRIIDISEELEEYLLAAKAQWEIDREHFAPEHRNNDFVFYTESGNHITPSNVDRALHRIIERYDLSPITTHGLRHTHATHMLMALVPVKIVSERLGHASIEITLNTYAHVLPTIQAGAVQQYEEYLRRQLHPPETVE